MASQFETIIILDFGSQYTQLIARRIREIGVYCEIHPYSLAPETIRAAAPRGIILSGGRVRSTRKGPLIVRRRSSDWGCRSSASATGFNC